MNAAKTSWPTFEYLGKTYARERGDILVWRLASRRTGRWHWVLVRRPPAAVIAALALDGRAA